MVNASVLSPIATPLLGELPKERNNNEQDNKHLHGNRNKQYINDGLN